MSEGRMAGRSYLTIPPSDLPTFRPSVFHRPLAQLPVAAVALCLPELVAELVPGVLAAPHRGAPEAGGTRTEGGTGLGAGAGGGEQCSAGAQDHAESEASPEDGDFLPVGVAMHDIRQGPMIRYRARAVCGAPARQRGTRGAVGGGSTSCWT